MHCRKSDHYLSLSLNDSDFKKCHLLTIGVWANVEDISVTHTPKHTPTPSFSPPSPAGPTCRVPSQVSCTWESQKIFPPAIWETQTLRLSWKIFVHCTRLKPLQRVTMLKLTRQKLSSTASSGPEEKGFLIQGRESCLKLSEAIPMFGLWSLCNLCPPATQAAQLLPR